MIKISNNVYGEKINANLFFDGNGNEELAQRTASRLAYFVAASRKIGFDDTYITISELNGVVSAYASTFVNGVQRTIEDSNNTNTRCQIFKVDGKRSKYRAILKGENDNTNDTNDESNEDANESNEVIIATNTNDNNEITNEDIEALREKIAKGKKALSAFAFADKIDMITAATDNKKTKIVDELLIITDSNEAAKIGLTFVNCNDFCFARDIKSGIAFNEGKLNDAINAEMERRKNEAQKSAQGLRTEAAQGLALAKACRENKSGLAPYFYGPAGTGKSTLVIDIAKKLELPVYTQSAVFNEFELFGFADANGNFVETAFYKAWTNGGVFLLDELDCSDVPTIKKLNGAIANRCYCFPVVGNIEQNENCYIFATGNTMFKPDANYTAAGLMDISSVDRFIPIYVGYSDELERSIARNQGCEDVALFVQDVRAAVNRIKSTFCASMRLTQKLIAFRAAGLSENAAIDSCFVSFMDNNNLRTLYENLNDKDSKYAKAIYANVL